MNEGIHEFDLHFVQYTNFRQRGKILNCISRSLLTMIIVNVPQTHKLYFSKFQYMNTKVQHTGLVLWAARLLTIAFAIFISLFAMDVFNEGYGFWKTLLGLFMHLLPTLVILIILLIAWHKAIVGGVFYILLAITYIVFASDKFDWTAYALIPAPMIIIGILFFIGWYQKKHQSV